MADQPEVRLRSLLMLGHWAQQRAALDRAVAAVPEDPADWTDTGVTAALWAQRFGDAFVEEMPTIIKESGLRPAHAVAALLRSALLTGIEIGRRLERDERG